MKILIITPSYKPAFVYGGPIFSVAYLSEQLSLNNDVLVICTTANGSDELGISSTETQNIDGVFVKYFKRQTKDHSHLSIGLLKYLWQNGNKFDIINIQSWWNLVAVFSALICKIRGWKYVITPRGMLSPYTYQSSILKKVIHFFIGNSLLKSAIIQATANDEALKIESLNSKYKVYIIPNFVNLKTPIVPRKINDVFQLLFLSRIHPKKGLDVLIKSLPLLNFDCHLNIVGDGDLNYINSLKKIAVDYKVSDKITWHGSLYDEKKFEIYAHSDIMVLPSHDENFANNVLESLLMGTPVIITENVGLATFVHHNELGWTFKGGEIQLAACINKAINSKEMLKRINEEARVIVLKEFDNAKLINSYIDLYTNT